MDALRFLILVGRVARTGKARPPTPHIEGVVWIIIILSILGGLSFACATLLLSSCILLKRAEESERRNERVRREQKNRHLGHG